MFVLVNLKAYPVDPIAIGGMAADVDADAEASIAVAPQAADLSGAKKPGQPPGPNT